MSPSEHSYPTTQSFGYPNRTEAAESDFKFNLTKVIEAFSKDMNRYLKEISFK